MNMNDGLITLSLAIMGIGAVILVLGVILLIIGLIVKNKKMTSTALKMIVIGTIADIAGFTLCTSSLILP
ncbi:hypothetical protein FACS1894181_03930 [Bacteroidia bacterium]|nr:hypothetical protein FACS1894181_03930 [Bacteroidia bacterium]